MQILRSIVAPSTAFMTLCDFKMACCSPVRSQVICDELVQKPYFFNSLCMSFSAARLLRLVWTRSIRFFMRSLQTIGEVRVSTTEHSSFFGGRREVRPPDAGLQTVPVRRAYEIFQIEKTLAWKPRLIATRQVSAWRQGVIEVNRVNHISRNNEACGHQNEPKYVCLTLIFCRNFAT